MNREKKRSVLLWSVGMVVMLFVAGSPQTGFAQSKNDFSALVLHNMDIRVFCTQYKDDSSANCVSGFAFPFKIIILDRNTGMLYLQVPETTIETFPAVDSIGQPFQAKRIKASGKIKTCPLAQEGLEFSSAIFPTQTDNAFNVFVNCP